ncbi:hypothetical protein AB0958_16120 [Streptomyces sp. NPDC006655]|uniref:hypothetical protein n=1 Tax=Streptomyces sp. NPDC006655 TaxID=3156898 RepID=UPI003452F228
MTSKGFGNPAGFFATAAITVALGFGVAVGAPVTHLASDEGPNLVPSVPSVSLVRTVAAAHAHTGNPNAATAGTDGDEGPNIITAATDGDEGPNIITAATDGDEGPNIVVAGTDGDEGPNVVAV